MIKIKKNWDEVTIADFLLINGILNDDVMNSLEKKIAIVAALAGVEEKELDEYPISQIHEWFRESDFIYDRPNGAIKDYYFIGEKRYKLCKELNHLTAAQFIDLSTYTKSEEEILGNLHLICTALLLPAPFDIKPVNGFKKIISKAGIKKYESEIINYPVEKYLQTPQDETAENIFNNMSISDAMGISVFFCLLYNVCLKITRDYLEMEMETRLKSALMILENPEMKEQVQILLNQMTNQKEIGSKKNTNGLQLLIQSLKETEQNGNISSN